MEGKLGLLKAAVSSDRLFSVKREKDRKDEVMHIEGMDTRRMRMERKQITSFDADDLAMAEDSPLIKQINLHFSFS